jgi:glycosyltransferase involved in cell wall biosynthesis
VILAGQVYPFSYHEEYFRRDIRPHLDGKYATMVDSPTLEQKRDLLQHARAILVPSLVEETSCLVAMEAMACGTPVVAFRRGAIPEVVAHGRTGFVVDTVQQMADAVERLGEIDAFECRSYVEEEYSAAAMADRYEDLYDRVLRSARPEMVRAA